MRFTSRTSLAVSLVLAGTLSALVTSACGSTPEPTALPDAATPVPTGPGPGPALDASNPDAGTLEGLPPPAPPKQDELTEPFGIFVATTGAPDGAGTRAAPLSTMSAGITKAKAEKKRLYVCAGTYAEALTLEDGVSVVANLDCTTPTAWKLGGAHAVLASPTSPALTAKDIKTPTRVDGLDVVAPAGTETEPSSIGLLAMDSIGLTMTSGKLDATAGRAGSDATTPVVTVASSPAPDADPVASCFDLAGNPCTRGSFSDRLGKPGGVQRCSADGVEFLVLAGGAGGNSAVYDSAGVISPVTQGKAGSTPFPTAAGTDGTSSSGGAFTDGAYLPGDGTSGSNGNAGKGGRGGHGETSRPARAGVSWTVNGAGGGAGGCPGVASKPGKGGGASIGALLRQSPVRFEKMTIRSGAGGSGGRGNFGAPPTQGQLPGTPNSSSCNVQTESGCSNAFGGGVGTLAGISGHGVGGPSLAVVQDGAAKATLVDSTLAHGTGGTSPQAMTQNGQTIPAAAPAAAADKLDL